MIKKWENRVIKKGEEKGKSVQEENKVIENLRLIHVVHPEFL